MSLFGSLQLGANTLRATQIGLHVVGNNIANANTPGFVREKVIYSPAPTQRLGNLVLGLGVNIDGIVQQIDSFVQDRLRDAKGDRANAEVQEQAYRDLESRLVELTGVDISTALTDFFGSLDAVLESPGDLAARNLAVISGQTLTQRIDFARDAVTDIRKNLNQRVVNIGQEINDLTGQIRAKKINKPER